MSASITFLISNLSYFRFKIQVQNIIPAKQNKDLTNCIVQ